MKKMKALMDNPNPRCLLGDPVHLPDQHRQLTAQKRQLGKAVYNKKGLSQKDKVSK